MKVLDISYCQGADFPFKAFVACGYDGVIIRTGDGVKQDKQVLYNLANAKEAGMHIGVYHYSRAKTIADGMKEGQLVKEIISGYEDDLTLGIFLDMEVYKESQWHSDAYRGFCTIFTDTYLKIGIYTCEYNYNHYFDKDFFSGVRKWIAKYSKTIPNIGQEIWGWQYTSGVDTNEPYKKPLDRSIVFDDISENNGTLGTGSPDKPEVDIWWVIKDILDGKYGDGEDRKAAMAAIGLDYDNVQTLVNKHYAIAMEVIAGKYGNFPTRKALLESIGYNYEVVQKIVTAIIH